MRKVSLRFLMAVVSIILQEAAIAILVIFGLPQFGVRLPWGVLVAAMAGWLLFSTFLYTMGSRALRQKPYPTLANMVGTHGRVVNTLKPDGVVRIRGELWIARSADKKLDTGTPVIVVKQDGLKLVVRKATPEEAET